MKTPITAIALSVGLLVACAPAAHAGIIMTPAGLGPGDQFRVIFVSSATRNASSSDIAEYDTFITNLASAAGLTYNGASVTWQALGSTVTFTATSIDLVSANDPGRLPVDVSSPALYRLDGVEVADSTSDLWDGNIGAAIDVDENGVG